MRTDTIIGKRAKEELEIFCQIILDGRQMAKQAVGYTIIPLEQAKEEALKELSNLFDQTVIE